MPEERTMTAVAARKPLYSHLYFQVVTAIIIGILLGYFYPKVGEQMKPGFSSPGPSFGRNRFAESRVFRVGVGIRWGPFKILGQAGAAADEQRPRQGRQERNAVFFYHADASRVYRPTVRIRHIQDSVRFTSGRNSKDGGVLFRLASKEISL